MKIVATADLHGYLPDIPKCDLLLIGGDVCPVWDHDMNFQLDWLDTTFRDWLNEIPAKTIVGIAGNHDFIFEKDNAVEDLALPWIYLRDSETVVDGLKIYGLPWVPKLVRWAFYATKEELAKRYKAIPIDTDIVLSHGPPYGYGDRLADVSLKASEGYNSHAGARAATDMLARVKPRVFVCGHIHEAFGHYHYQGQHSQVTDIYNVSYVDVIYEPRGQTVDITFDDGPEVPTDHECEIRSKNPHARRAPQLVA